MPRSTLKINVFLLKLKILFQVDTQSEGRLILDYFMKQCLICLCESIRSDQICRSVVSDSLRPHESSMPGLPVHHQLPEFTQTHVHRVSDAIQPSHPLSSPSPPAPVLPSIRVFSNESTLHEVAKVLEFQLQHQSFQ